MVRPQTAQKITSSAIRAGSTMVPPKLTLTPSAPPAIAVTVPIRKPPNAVAKNTAGIYGVKNTSGLIWARPERDAVAKARQKLEKPTLKSGEGWKIPCQPLLNSSINFIMGVVTSRDQRIQNKAELTANPQFVAPPKEACGLPPVNLCRTCPLALVPTDGDYRARRREVPAPRKGMKKPQRGKRWA